MGNQIEDLYDSIKDLKTKEEFQQEINQLQTEYDYLFDEQTSALFIVDQLGRNTAGQVTIADLHPGLESTVIGAITQIQPPRTFQRKNGSTGRVANLIITDDTGSIPLVLWGDDVELVTNKDIQLNTQLKVINGYTKKGYNGTEITVGRWSSIEILKTHHRLSTEQQKQTPETTEITGTIQQILPTTVFFKNDGSYGFVAKLKLRTKKGQTLITLWDDQVKQMQQYKTGDLICIQQVDVKQNNGTKEIHVNGKATITRVQHPP